MSAKLNEFKVPMGDTLRHRDTGRTQTCLEWIKAIRMGHEDCSLSQAKRAIVEMLKCGILINAAEQR